MATTNQLVRKSRSAVKSKSNVFLVAPKYQFILTSAYQARYGINLGMNYVARQGYSTPYYLGEHAGTEDDLNPSGRNILLSTNIGDARLPMVHSFDARVSKVLRINRLTADVDLDFFNLFNSNTVLGRQFDLAFLERQHHELLEVGKLEGLHDRYRVDFVPILVGAGRRSLCETRRERQRHRDGEEQRFPNHDFSSAECPAR